jgi:hypothetical protein
VNRVGGHVAAAPCRDTGRHKAQFSGVEAARPRSFGRIGIDGHELKHVCRAWIVVHVGHISHQLTARAQELTEVPEDPYGRGTKQPTPLICRHLIATPGSRSSG